MKNICYLCPKFFKLLGNEQYRPFHIYPKHWCEFHSAHHGLRIWNLHHDDASVPDA